MHHGNGTENIFRNDPRVLFCSAFQSPFYPYSGENSSNEHIINSPLPAGTDGTALRQVVEEEWLPRLNEFAPQLILVSAGFDGHRDDAYGGSIENRARLLVKVRRAVAHCARSALAG